jgi:hypothetical protein
MDPVGVGALDALAVDAHRVAGVSDDGAVGRHIGDHDAVRSDLRAVTDRDRTEQLRAGADRDVVLNGGVALAGGEAGAAEGDALVEVTLWPISAVSPITTPAPWSMNRP